MDHAALIEQRRPWLRESELVARSTQAATGPDPVILERIVAAFRRAKQAERDLGVVRGGPWQRIRSEHMGELTSLLEVGHPAPLNDYLRELAIRQAGHGFFQGKPTFDVIDANPASQRQRLLWIADSVCGLAEWLGLVGVSCPEGRPTAPAPPPQLDELAARIEARTGLPLRVPDICGGLFGLAAGGGVVHVRSTTAVYAALRIQRALRDCERRPLEQSRVCEIGPGIGLVAFMLGRLGARELTLVDLPELNAMQAYFLAQALPNHPLALFAEPDPPPGPALRIVPDFEFLSGSTGRFDLIFNQDSLPELDLETVRRYLDLIPRGCRLFLSFNQETRVPVGTPPGAAFLPALLPDSQQVRCLERSPSWLRAGYVEELFACAAEG